MNYHILREIADSWVLLVLLAFFVAVVLWVLRPGSVKVHSDAANIPFRNETTPAGADRNRPKPAEKREART